MVLHVQTLGKWVIALMVVGLVGCSARQKQEIVPEPELPVDVAPQPEYGLFPVSEAESIRLSQQLQPSRQKMASWKDMTFAVDQSLDYVRGKTSSQIAMDFAGRQISFGELKQSLQTLRKLLPRLDAHPELVGKAFQWYRLGPDFGFTGYYEPELAASMVRTERFKYPLYRVPSDLRSKKARGAYYSRHQIACKGVLRGKGLELAWVDNPVDLAILQIQGSGRLRFPDGTIRYALYAGQNGHPYVPVGRVMIDQGLLTREEMSMKAIRDWLMAHPGQQEAILDRNPSYVFFRFGDTGSYGSMGRHLTPWASVATDQSVLPNGTLSVMHLNLPDVAGKMTESFTGLLLPQDTGGAIKRHRVDLFCGAGSWAQHTASFLNTRGAVFLLLPRESR